MYFSFFICTFVAISQTLFFAFNSRIKLSEISDIRKYLHVFLTQILAFYLA